MRTIDEQERLILREIIRDPRESDNGIAQKSGVSVRTVGRKRARLEEEGILSYLAHIDLTTRGAGHFGARHLYIIKFAIGVTPGQVLADIQREPRVRTIFSEVIFESHIAEIDGHTALLLFIDGVNDADIVQTVQDKLVRSLRTNHGHNSIEEIKTIRVLAPVRVMRNYILPVNVERGYLRKDWPNEAIFVGK